MDSHDAITSALKAIVPVSVSVALGAVALVSLREKREDVTWWHRGAAWLAIAKGTRFVLESIVCSWIAVAGVLPGPSMTYQAVVCTLYLATVPLLGITASRLLRGDIRAQRSGMTVACMLVAIETGLWFARRSFVSDGATRAAVGIASVSMHGSVMMAMEALVIGLVTIIRPTTLRERRKSRRT